MRYKYNHIFKESLQHVTNWPDDLSHCTAVTYLFIYRVELQKLPKEAAIAWHERNW
jgi:hypothetical protein